MLRNLGFTTFVRAHWGALVDAGLLVVFNQVQFSLRDRGPLESGLGAWGVEHGVAVLAYGALGGGFLSDRWLNRDPPQTAEDVPTASLQMYCASIKRFGSWELFQLLLRTLQQVGAKHGVGIAAVALRWVLEQDAVAAVLVGMRNARNLEANLQTFSFALSPEDHGLINAVLGESAQTQVEEVYESERRQPDVRIKFLLNWMSGKRAQTSTDAEPVKRVRSNHSQLGGELGKEQQQGAVLRAEAARAAVGDELDEAKAMSRRS
eukprot:TRINITY_DN2958_c0_g1_i9.p1 TRINITY_DN2958_c0_g1~~TRINITY_DN2958_c0_g1_i9.p1  ORF type:complete len:263 (+),score=68.57 TRINITY_DN2958_c0_g1_i9:52-840(+)